ncbi:MAG: hypothetical protein M3440_08880 [Chloroflexota bacterium]|nr:hypothetical protein [Chloroflexota bacterium]
MTDIEIFRERIMVPGPSGTVVGGDAITSLQTRVTELERVLNSQIESVTTGRFYGPLSVLSGYPTPTGAVATQNRLYATPVYIPQNGTFNVAGIEITTAVAAATVRLGIYAALANGLPGALVADFGTIDATVAGFRSVPITITLPRGSYWLAGVSNNSTIAMLRILAAAGVTATMGHVTTDGTSPRNALQKTDLLADNLSLPATFGPAGSLTSIFAFWLQAA